MIYTPKQLLLLAAFFLFSISSNAQILNPVHWSWEAKKTGDNTYKLTFIAKIDKGWHVYSQFLAEGGPVPTKFTFEKNADVQIVGKTAEKGDIEHEGRDPIFEMNVKKFDERVVFVQEVKVTKDTKLKGSLEFMTCNDEKCLPPDSKDFEFNLTSSAANASEQKKNEVTTSSEAPSSPIKITLNGKNNSSPGILHPVHWKVTLGSVNETDKTLLFTAAIDKGWHIYSQFGADGGPVETAIHFDPNDNIQVNAKPEETGNSEEKFDSIFGMKVKTFSEMAMFSKKLKIKQPKGIVKGFLEYMSCDNGRCLPPESISFSVNLETGEATIVEEKDNKKEATTGQKFGTPLSDCGGNNTGVAAADLSIWSIIIAGFLAGLLALITPCVFPMIPLTVSFFTKRNENKAKGRFEAFFYAFSIIAVCVLIALPLVLFNLSSDTFNEISTGAPLNIFFFLIFVVFAFSFFGYYELTLPSKLANSADNASNTGGLLGIFFMAATLIIVSFSCTGPVIGSLLVGAAKSGGGIKFIAGMTSFGTALALPFGLFALFPGWLKSLPKSGGWLNTVKVVLGFIELILAIKFLSNADLVSHWCILKREIFLGLWILLSLGIFFYLIGVLKFPHDSPVHKISSMRWGFAGLALAFALYCSSGLFGNDLHLLSGFPPPKFYSLFKQESQCPHNLNCFHDYNEALEYAKKENKPVMIDFTGWACVNCRKMEENVWIKPEVYKRINEDFILVSLYVDDKMILADSLQYVSDLNGKKIKTLGNKWSDMQAKYFNSNSQPYYALISPDEKLLNQPRGYTPDVKDYLSFLDCGLNTWKGIKK